MAAMIPSTDPSTIQASFGYSLCFFSIDMVPELCVPDNGTCWAGLVGLQRQDLDGLELAPCDPHIRR